MPRYDSYRTVAREDKRYRDRRAADQAVEDLYQDVLAKRAALNDLDDTAPDSAGRAAAFAAWSDAYDKLAAAAPKHHHFS